MDKIDAAVKVVANQIMKMALWHYIISLYYDENSFATEPDVALPR